VGRRRGPGPWLFLRLIVCCPSLHLRSAVKSRADQLKLDMTDEQVKDATAKIKELADTRTQSMDDVDRILRIYHTAVNSGELKVGDQEVLQELLDKVSVPRSRVLCRS
jgi:isopropylmalate/homocitrate/citramalate synthase